MVVALNLTTKHIDDEDHNDPLIIKRKKNLQFSSGKNGSESSVIDVGCGSRHTVCLSLGNNLWSFGWNKYGQLGLGDTKSRDQVAKVPLPRAINRYAKEIINL